MNMEAWYARTEPRPGIQNGKAVGERKGRPMKKLISLLLAL